MQLEEDVTSIVQQACALLDEMGAEPQNMDETKNLDHGGNATSILGVWMLIIQMGALMVQEDFHMGERTIMGFQVFFN
jgi:hypothetical protein